MGGRGSFWFLLHSPGIMDFVGYNEVEGTVHIWEKPAEMTPAPSLGGNKRTGLSLAP